MCALLLLGLLSNAYLKKEVKTRNLRLGFLFIDTICADRAIMIIMKEASITTKTGAAIITSQTKIADSFSTTKAKQEYSQSPSSTAFRSPLSFVLAAGSLFLGLSVFPNIMDS